MIQEASTPQSPSGNLIPLYFINLTERTDRLHSFQKHFAKSGLLTHRIPAIKADEVLNEHQRIITDPALACLLSHQKAWKTFLESSSKFAIIAEDDAQIRNINRLKNFLESVDPEEIDLLQIGFLINKFSERIDLILFNIEALFFRFLATRTKISPERLRIREQAKITTFLVSRDIRAGGHFYLINRVMAEELISMSRSAFLTADGLLMTTNWARSLRVYRTRRSLVSQTNSASSIKGKW